MAGHPPLRPGWGLLALIYPFAAGAMALNVFFASLILSWVGAPVLSPNLSLVGGLLLGIPATWAFARHIRRLIAKAEEAP